MTLRSKSPHITLGELTACREQDNRVGEKMMMLEQGIFALEFKKLMLIPLAKPLPRNVIVEEPTVMASIGSKLSTTNVGSEGRGVAVVAGGGARRGMLRSALKQPVKNAVKNPRSIFTLIFFTFRPF